MQLIRQALQHSWPQPAGTDQSGDISLPVSADNSINKSDTVGQDEFEGGVGGVTGGGGDASAGGGQSTSNQWTEEQVTAFARSTDGCSDVEVIMELTVKMVRF